MDAQYHRFTIGEVEAFALWDGGNHLGSEGLMRRFPDRDEAALRQAYIEAGAVLDDEVNSLNPLLLRIGGETVLIDTGEGSRPDRGLLPASLALAGIAPEAVTRVIITHTHGDHVQGLLTADGQPTYPNATYLISADELAFWQQRIDAGTADPHRPFLALIQAQGLRVIAMDEPILPGLTAVPLPGHTPGQIGVLVTSGGEQVIHVADALHNRMQFVHPDWSPRFDADTRYSVHTRQTLLAQAADKQRLLMAYHLPFPGLGRVRRAASGPNFQWEPVRG